MVRLLPTNNAVFVVTILLSVRVMTDNARLLTVIFCLAILGCPVTSTLMTLRTSLTSFSMRLSGLRTIASMSSRVESLKIMENVVVVDAPVLDLHRRIGRGIVAV